MSDPQHTQEDLLGAIQMLAQALEDSIRGHPVRNAPHCFALAENLTEGTDFEYRHYIGVR